MKTTVPAAHGMVVKDCEIPNCALAVVPAVQIVRSAMTYSIVLLFAPAIRDE